MYKFAKIFEGESQILVVRQNNDDGNPEVRFYSYPRIDGLDVCSIAIGFPDTDTGADKRDELFELVDEKIAKEVIAKMIEEIVEVEGET